MTVLDPGPVVAVVPDVVTEVEVLRHLDFDHQPFCSVPQCVGDRGPARHLLVATRCPCTVPICPECITALRLHVADWLDDVRCLTCFSVMGGCYLGDLFRIEPIS